MATGPGPLRSLLNVVAFAASTAVSLALGVLLVAAHTPYLTKSDSFRTLAHTLGDSQPGCWRVAHLLAAGCACSRGVAEHLLTRGPIAGVDEQVVFAGASPELESRLIKAGFRVRAMSTEQFAEQLGIVAAPQLIIVSPQGYVRYAGGYTPVRDPRSGYQDVSIWRRLAAGQDVPALPAYGCAIGKRLQRRLDPLGLKYE